MSYNCKFCPSTRKMFVQWIKQLEPGNMNYSGLGVKQYYFEIWPNYFWLSNLFLHEWCFLPFEGCRYYVNWPENPVKSGYSRTQIPKSLNGEIWKFYHEAIVKSLAPLESRVWTEPSTLRLFVNYWNSEWAGGLLRVLTSNSHSQKSRDIKTFCNYDYNQWS